MLSHGVDFTFSPNYDFGSSDDIFVPTFSKMSMPFPPAPGNFQLLDGTDFLLLDGTNFLLL
jgi:pantothenate kinase